MTSIDFSINHFQGGKTKVKKGLLGICLSVAVMGTALIPSMAEAINLPYHTRATKKILCYLSAGGQQKGWIDPGDDVVINRVSGNWAYVNYPVPGGRTNRWIVLSEIYSEPVQAPSPSDHEANVKQRIAALAHNTNGYRVNTRYTGDYQCRGFANKVYTTLFYGVSSVSGFTSDNYGVNSCPGSYQVGRLANFSEYDYEAVKNLFFKAKSGAFIQVGMRKYKNSSGDAPKPHSAILEGCNNDGVEIYEANADSRNTIQLNWYNWSDFTKLYKGVTLYMPNNYRLK